MNLLITGAWQSAKENIGKIEQMGHVVSFCQYEKDELPCEYEWVEGVICNGLFLYHPIERFSNLKYIQLTSAGFDRVPMEYVKEHDIEIHNARGVYSIPMAEFAVSGVLQLYKQASYFRENQKLHRWEKHRGLKELYGKTVCIVGCGSVGTECAKRFQAFGCNVIGIATSEREQLYFDEVKAADTLDEVLVRADVVVLTVPLAEDTWHMIDEERFEKIKNGAILVNIARGAIVDGNALEKALDGRLGGAVLDVFEEEPLSADSPLWNKGNVIITSHNSFVGEGNQERLCHTIFSNME
ncbi:NAD(P)-dependent oxidoreductase [Bariatricus sp. SGI.154]|uniref:NAD(P)-dependent oxidoreductase n=1 Tax=Bariatricus sp. SGI.154 TaxID=3420549 RepID=UPI003D070AFA